MKYQLTGYTCGHCHSYYKAPSLSSNSYGEFLLHSLSGEVRYMNALEDPVYEEVEELIKEMPAMRDVSEVKLARQLQSMFGIACDLDSNGCQFSIIAKPKCPICGRCEPSSWMAIEPAEFVEIDFPLVTHGAWSKLSKDEKLSLLVSRAERSNNSGVPCGPF